jgi:hypothetical protein
MAMARSDVPISSSRTQAARAARDEPQAASMAMFGPPRLKRLATRPAAMFSRMPGNESSVHSGRMPWPRLTTSVEEIVPPGIDSRSGMQARKPYDTDNGAPPPPMPTTAAVRSRGNGRSE